LGVALNRLSTPIAADARTNPQMRVVRSATFLHAQTEFWEKETPLRLQQLADRLGYSADELIDTCAELGIAYDADSDVDVELLADALDEHAARRARPKPAPTKRVFNGPTLLEVWLSHFRRSHPA
jgi:hypothetical protein